ncbi:MAG: hypothetical protein ACOH2E_02920 [Candidatus Paracaedibacter sp.]
MKQSRGNKLVLVPWIATHPPSLTLWRSARNDFSGIVKKFAE